MWASTRWLRALLACVLTISACGAGSSARTSPSAPSAVLDVVVTTSVLADIVRNVGGDRVSVSSLIPPGVGPEDYEPTPNNARTLVTADLVVSNGFGLDDFLGDLIGSAGRPDTPQVVLGAGIAAISVNGHPNPHFWLDPTLVRDHYVPTLRAALTRLDPAGDASYVANAARYGELLDEVDRQAQAALARVPEARRKLVTSHDAFPYFARRYGFELVGVILPNPGQEPTSSDLAALIGTLRAAGVPAVFSEAQFSPRLARTLADEAGVKVVSTLYTDALGPAPADTYLGLIRWDAGQIAQALSG